MPQQLPIITSPSHDSLFIVPEELRDDKEFISALAEAEAMHDFLEPIEEYPSSAFDYSEQYFADNNYQLADIQNSQASSVSTVYNYHLVSANLQAGLPWNYKLEEVPEYTEVFYEGDTWKLLCDVPRPPGDGEV